MAAPKEKLLDVAGRPVRPDWVKAVLDFWYRQLGPAQWFKKDPALDATITTRFLALHEAIAREVPAEAQSSAKAALAAIITLDQLPRNMFRGTPRAFATDPIACALARRTVNLGLDRLLRRDERVFIYVVFEHAEDKAIQARSVELMRTLGDDEWTKYAVAHQVIVDRFGRFPHRNAILGRESTPEEIAFLATPGSSF
jgi:uncharacterized protein (DUF924 family)